MRYKLAPFCSWRQLDNQVVLRTPDYELRLKSDAATILTQLEQSWVSESPELVDLYEYRAVIRSETTRLRLLYRLDRYFSSEGLELFITRKGSTTEAAALGRDGYLFQLGTLSSGLGQARGHRLALLKAAVELYERIACDVAYNRELILTDPIAPRLPTLELVDYAPWQWRRADFPFIKQPSGKWIEAHEVRGNCSRAVPLEVVCYPDSLTGDRCTYANSNGVASHTSYEKALLGSVWELVERDALMLHWFNKIPRERIIPPAILAGRLARLQALGFQTSFLNLTVDTLPVVLVILQREAKLYPHLILGMAAHPDPKVAMDKALQEAEINITFFDIEVKKIPNQEAVADVLDHQLWYDRSENHCEVTQLIGAEEINIAKMTPGPATIEGISSLLHQQGLQWYMVSLNQRGLEATGVWTIRSIIPGLIPIAFGFRMEPLGLPRLHKLPATLGDRKRDSARLHESGYRIQPFS